MPLAFDGQLNGALGNYGSLIGCIEFEDCVITDTIQQDKYSMCARVDATCAHKYGEREGGERCVEDDCDSKMNEIRSSTFIEIKFLRDFKQAGVGIPAVFSLDCQKTKKRSRVISQVISTPHSQLCYDSVE